MDGPHTARAGGGKTYKGSKKHLRQIRFRDTWSVAFWILIVVLLIQLFVVVPWLIRHPPDHIDHPPGMRVEPDKR